MAFSDPKFHPVWAKAEELGVPLFIHPQGVPELNKQVAGNGWLTNAISYPVETTIALSHMIFEGTFDRFPKLKVIAAHGGGFLPSYADRSDHACLVNPAGCNPDIKLSKKRRPNISSRSISIRWCSRPRRSAISPRKSGAGQIVLGSDYPFPWQLAAGRPRLRLDLAQRRRQGRHPRPHRGEADGDGGVGRIHRACGAASHLSEHWRESAGEVARVAPMRVSDTELSHPA